jgi:hypothetical protein
LIKTFPVCFNNRKESFTFRKNWLESIIGYLQRFQTKIKRKQKKEKDKEKEKMEKGWRQHFGLVTETAHGPLPPSPELVSFSLSSCC